MLSIAYSLPEVVVDISSNQMSFFLKVMQILFLSGWKEKGESIAF